MHGVIPEVGSREGDVYAILPLRCKDREDVADRPLAQVLIILKSSQ